MKKVELEKKAAELESMNSRIISELIFVDQLMRDIGFLEGLQGLKSTAKKIKKSK